MAQSVVIGLLCSDWSDDSVCCDWSNFSSKSSSALPMSSNNDIVCVQSMKTKGWHCRNYY